MRASGSMPGWRANTTSTCFCHASCMLSAYRSASPARRTQDDPAVVRVRLAPHDALLAEPGDELGGGGRRDLEAVGELSHGHAPVMGEEHDGLQLPAGELPGGR